MVEILQGTLDRAVLNKLFELARRTDNHLNVHQISALFDFDISARRIEMSLDQLENDEMIGGILSTIEETTYAISRKGYLAVERGRQEDESFDRLYAEFGDDWLNETGGLESDERAAVGGEKSTTTPVKPYSEFRDLLILALYKKSMADGLEIFNLSAVASEYSVNYSEGWIIEAAKYFEESGYALYSGVMGGDDVQSARITDGGMAFAEELLEEQKAITAMGLDEASSSDDLPTVIETTAEAASTWDDTKGGNPWGNSWGRAPASDRVVPLDHNAPEYVEAVKNIEELQEQVRGANEFATDRPEEHSQVVSELEAIHSLLKAKQVNPSRLEIVAWGVLGWLAAEFAGQPMGELAKAAWEALKVLIGIG